MEHKITLIMYLNNHLLKEILVESSLFEFFFFVNKSITVLLKLSIELIESFLHIKADVKFILSPGIEFFNSLISSQWTIIIIVIIRFISVWSPGKINRSFTGTIIYRPLLWLIFLCPPGPPSFLLYLKSPTCNDIS